MNIFNSKVQLGCGLVRIGRVWGVKGMDVPTEEKAIHFLVEAFKIGIRIFDTAPAYGFSEERLGVFLRSLGESERKQCFVATKCGEEYDFDKHETCVDHCVDRLQESIERSFKRLGHISLLQIHKATPELLRNNSILDLLAQYKGRDIPYMGASVTDVETAEIGLASSFFDCVQFPYNQQYPELRPIFHSPHTGGKTFLISRPFASGASFVESTGKQQGAVRNALAFVLEEMEQGGTILVGTNDIDHLREDISLFNELQL